MLSYNNYKNKHVWELMTEGTKTRQKLKKLAKVIFQSQKLSK